MKDLEFVVSTWELASFPVGEHRISDKPLPVRKAGRDARTVLLRWMEEGRAVLLEIEAATEAGARCKGGAPDVEGEPVARLGTSPAKPLLLQPKPVKRRPDKALPSAPAAPTQLTFAHRAAELGGTAATRALLPRGGTGR